MARRQSEFMHLVETHEREWGTRTYPRRPSLSEILSMPVVVFWEVEKQSALMISLHESLDDLEKTILRSLLLTRTPAARRRPARIFLRQKRMTIRQISIEFVEASDNDPDTDI